MRVAIARLIVCALTSLVLVNFVSAKPTLKSLAVKCEDKLSCSINSIVSILPIWPASIKRQEEPEGSGVVVGDGQHIITALHVIEPATKLFVRTEQGVVMPAKFVLRDETTDIAILKIDKKLEPIVISKKATVGQKACAIGNAFGLSLSMSCGVVSATQMSGTGFNRIEDFIQSDAAVNPGMSGGALVNEDGELIGMLSAIFTKNSDANIGVNFAVSSELILKVLTDHLKGNSNNRIIPGVRLGPSLKPGEAGIIGAKIFAIEETSAEAKAGLKVGDVIISFNGRRLKRAGAYLAALSLIDKGHTALIELMRGEEPMTLKVKY